MELRDALTQISEIRRQVARTEVFRGYHAMPMAFSGLLALGAAGFQAVWIPDPAEHLTVYLALWVGTAILSVVAAGNVALEVPRAPSGEMKNVEALVDLIGYLEARRPSLPDDATRQRAGWWIASNRVEKFNDWSVSARWKHQGMEWTEAGVVSLAVLEATRRNGELPTWRAKHSLPTWKIPKGRKKVA